jgi:ketosteroid isomerase-like protein
MNLTSKNSTDVTAIRALIERWAEAVRNHDYDTILADHDPEIVMFDVPPPIRSRGLDEYRRTWDLFFEGHRPSNAFDVLDLDIVAGDNVAFAVAMMRCEGAHDKGKPSYFLHFRLTVGLRKIEGRWRVVHEHHSVPAT